MHWPDARTYFRIARSWILQFAHTIYMMTKQSGFLTQLRSKIVSRQSLNTIARTIGLDRYVIANPTGITNQKHIYGDAFEALIGAIYLDQGYEFANRLLINNIYYRCLLYTSCLHKGRKPLRGHFRGTRRCGASGISDRVLRRSWSWKLTVVS